MSPTPMSPLNKHAQPTRAPSHDSTDGIRKRVCKACDRCRLKKSKCDGSSPCSRCKADNAICVFGERKRSHDKHYPKGYVEMLEQQQGQLVSGLKEMYHRLQKASAWEGAALDESTGQPLTHDILLALDLLEVKHDDSGEHEVFEENPEKLQARMIAEGAGFAHRRGSFSSDSEHSHHERPKTSSRQNTPAQLKLSMFKDNFNFASSASSPLTQSPIPQSKPFSPRPRSHASQPSIAATQSPQMPTTSYADPQLYAPDWAQALQDMQDPTNQPYRNKYAMQSADYETMMSPAWDPSQLPIDSFAQFLPYSNQMLGGNPFGTNGLGDIDLGAMDGMDLDFSKFVQQQEVMT